MPHIISIIIVLRTDFKRVQHHPNTSSPDELQCIAQLVSIKDISIYKSSITLILNEVKILSEYTFTNDFSYQMVIRLIYTMFQRRKIGVLSNWCIMVMVITRQFFGKSLITLRQFHDHK